MKTIRVKLWTEIPLGFTGLAIWDNGTKRWFKNDFLHREDGPAVEWVDGTKFWYQNDFLHRLDGPAIIKDNGEKKYSILNQELTKEEFDIFRYLWNNTNYERTNNLIEIFVKLAKSK